MIRNNLSISPASIPLMLMLALLVSTSTLKAQQTVSVAPIKLNVFYIGVDNPVSVAASGGADNQVTVSITGGGGSISKADTGVYNVHVTSPTDDCVVQVYIDGKPAGHSVFRVRHLPVPSASVGGFTSGEKLAAAAFQKQTGVGVYLKDFPFSLKFEVTGFNFTIGDEKGTTRSAEVTGNLFSPEVKQYMEELVKPGSTITIDKIRVKDPMGKERRVPALVYYIK